MSKRALKSDKYRKARGGYSRLLDLSCANCGQHICNYQKDGLGMLKRLYIDRIDGFNVDAEKIDCPNCAAKIGSKYIYEKENRPAYMLKQGALTKKIVKL